MSNVNWDDVEIKQTEVFPDKETEVAWEEYWARRKACEQEIMARHTGKDIGSRFAMLVYLDKHGDDCEKCGPPPGSKKAECFREIIRTYESVAK